jgi:anti-sigma B factor antagonist
MQSVLVQPRISVAQPSGHINAATAARFQEELVSAVSAQDCVALLVDLSQVESLDSAGLLALVSTLSLAQQLNRPFGLCHISPSIRIIFELTQLDRVFEIHEDSSAFEASIA